jgi:acetyl esterase/lipase
MDLRARAESGEDGAVPYAFLIVTLIGAVAVALAYRPIRREPFTVLSFTCGWISGELAFQNIVWQAVATALFIRFGALSNWAGWLGLAVAFVVWAGLIGLGIAGHRAASVTAAALTQVRNAAFPVPTEPTAPTWGRWWRVTRAIPFGSRAVRVTRNIDYWGDGNRRHRLDVYQSRLAPAGKAPVMVYIHGGAWMIGEKREQGKPMMYELVARGWVCVAINYRLSPKATWPDHIVDAKRAVAWVKEHIDDYGGDSAFVAVSGGSAGGHLCALLALSAGDPAFQPGFEEADTAVQACIPFYGVMDLTSSPDGAAIFGPGLRKMLEKSVMKCQESEHPALFRDASPTYRVRAEAPPFFVLQGVNDTLVPVESARVFVERLRAVSRQPVAYAELPLAQHAFDVLASLRCQATTSAVADFLVGARAAVGAAEGPVVTPPRFLSDVESAPEL